MMKKLLLLTFIFVFSFNAVSFAAVGGSRVRMSSPAPKAPTTQTAPSNPASSYKPSAPATSYSEKAPAAKSTAPSVQQPANNGGFMRNIGMFGGGMLLGSLMGGMFGFGNNGMLSTIFGLFFNIMIIMAVVMAGRYLWNRFRSSKVQKNRHF